MSAEFYIMLVTLSMLIVMLVAVCRMKNKRLLHHMFIMLTVELIMWHVGVLLSSFYMKNDPAMFVYMDNITYLGSAATPPTMVLLGLTYGKRIERFSKKLLPLFAIPLLTQLLVWTNDFHHLFFADYSLQTGYSLGPLFYIHGVYSYLCMLLGMGLLIVSAVRSSGTMSMQAVLIVVAAIIPVFTNTGYTLGIPGFSTYSTPMAFTISVLLLILGMTRFSLLRITPVALQTVIDRISDSFLVVDVNEWRVLDYNKSFQDQFVPSGLARGKVSLKKVIEESSIPVDFRQRFFENLQAVSRDMAIRSMDVEFDKDGSQKYFTLEMTPIVRQG
ncbi:MAG: hypothetical protein IJP03_04225, partial [Christensenellaceae bacterium]|nr:hypothetical protein [Christensenellaceae bacterium]